MKKFNPMVCANYTMRKANVWVLVCPHALGDSARSKRALKKVLAERYNGVFCEICQCGAPDVARNGFGGAR